MTLSDSKMLMKHLDTPKMRATHYFTLVMRDQGSSLPDKSMLKWAIYLIPFRTYMKGIAELIPVITQHLGESCIYVSQRFGGSLKII